MRATLGGASHPHTPERRTPQDVRRASGAGRGAVRARASSAIVVATPFLVGQLESVGTGSLHKHGVGVGPQQHGHELVLANPVVVRLGYTRPFREHPHCERYAPTCASRATGRRPSQGTTSGRMRLWARTAAHLTKTALATWDSGEWEPRVRRRSARARAGPASIRAGRKRARWDNPELLETSPIASTTKTVPDKPVLAATATLGVTIRHSAMSPSTSLQPSPLREPSGLVETSPLAATPKHLLDKSVLAAATVPGITCCRPVKPPPSPSLPVPSRAAAGTPIEDD